MSRDGGTSFDMNGGGNPHRSATMRPGRIWMIVAFTMLMSFGAGDFAEAATFRQGVSAFNRQDYAQASRIFIPIGSGFRDRRP